MVESLQPKPRSTPDKASSKPLLNMKLLQASSLLFDLEDPEEPLQKVEELDEVHACPVVAQLLQLTGVQGSRYHQQLKDDVTYFREQLMAEEGRVDIVDLACMLTSIGHDVVVRSAVGGGANCFRNLYHEFLCIRGQEDQDGVDLIVECNFREHFDIPCSTPRYRRLLNCIPMVFVGTVKALVPIVQAIATEMTLAFESNSLTKPPWRNAQSLMSKWAPLRVKDWLPTSSPRSSPHLSAATRDVEGGSLGDDTMRHRLSNSDHPIRCSSLGCATVLTPLPSHSRPMHSTALGAGHHVHVGFTKSALSTLDANVSSRGALS